MQSLLESEAADQFISSNYALSAARYTWAATNAVLDIQPGNETDRLRCSGARHKRI